MFSKDDRTKLPEDTGIAARTVVLNSQIELTKAVEAVISGRSGCAWLDEIARTHLESGEEWAVSAVILSEPVFKLIVPMLTVGIAEMRAAYKKLDPKGGMSFGATIKGALKIGR